MPNKPAARLVRVCFASPRTRIFEFRLRLFGHPAFVHLMEFKRTQHMKELAAVLGVGVVLAGCASKIEVPVTGQLGDGTPAAGMATANTNGTGTFWVKIPAGPRCAGRYDPYDRSPSIVVPVACTDGRTGETVITRELSGLSGTAIVQLSDGTRGQFVFGDLTFQQAFGSGSAETPTTLRVRSN